MPDNIKHHKQREHCLSLAHNFYLVNAGRKLLSSQAVVISMAI